MKKIMMVAAIAVAMLSFDNAAKAQTVKTTVNHAKTEVKGAAKAGCCAQANAAKKACSPETGKAKKACCSEVGKAKQTCDAKPSASLQTAGKKAAKAKRANLAVKKAVK